MSLDPSSLTGLALGGKASCRIQTKKMKENTPVFFFFLIHFLAHLYLLVYRLYLAAAMCISSISLYGAHPTGAVSFHRNQTGALAFYP